MCKHLKMLITIFYRFTSRLKWSFFFCKITGRQKQIVCFSKIFDENLREL